MAYVLNMHQVPAERFNWVEAFETWLQRKNVHANWRFSPAGASWEATINVAGSTIIGMGPTKQHAKKDAVIQIESAGILY